MLDSLTYSISSYYAGLSACADTLCSVDSVSTGLVANGFSGIMVDAPRVVSNFFFEWNLIVIFVVSLVLVINKHFFLSHIKQLLSSVLSNKSLGQMNREWTPSRSLVGLAVYLTSVLTFALFAQKFFVLQTHNYDLYNSFDFFCRLCLFFAIFFLSKHLIINFMGWLFHTKEAALHFANLHLSVLTITSVTLLFFILVILFNPYMIFFNISILIIILLWLIYLYRSFIEIVLFSKINSIYIFLYLCALEIIPYWVVIETIIRMIRTTTI